MSRFLQVKLRYNSWQRGAWRRKPHPRPEGSMHINGRGHRPLTSPFSRGRGGRLCETGFNDPIVDLCHAPPYSIYSLPCTRPEGVCVSLNRPAARVKGLHFLFLKKRCPLYHLLPAFSCLVSLFNTPHICFYLLSHHVLSSTSPAALPGPYLLSLPLFRLHFLKRGLITQKAWDGRKWPLLHHDPLTDFAQWKSIRTYQKFRFWPNLTSDRSGF